MREKTDMLFRLLARLQVSDRNGVVQFPAVIDRAQDQIDRRSGAVGTKQIALDWLIRSLEQLQARAFVGKVLLQLCIGHAFNRRSNETREAVVDGDDRVAFADQ